MQVLEGSRLSFFGQRSAAVYLVPFSVHPGVVHPEELTDADWLFLKLSVPIAAFIGGLCCFAPVVVVLAGIGSVSYAVSLTDLLYYEYAWAFRLAGLAFILNAFVTHLYTNEEARSVDAAVRKRRKILNLLGIAIILAALAYAVWLYVVVELIGMALDIW